ncbi:MAG: sugar ABC transporter permease, partial [Psychrobacillus psychrotolerans]
MTTVTKRRKISYWQRSSNVRTALLYLLPSIILFTVFVFYPMFRTIYLSFFLTDQAGEAAIFVGLENYTYLLESDAFLNSIKATFLFVLYTVPTGIIIALILALLANEKLRGIGFFRTIYASTMGVSVAASSVVWLFLFHPSVGMFNKFLNIFNLPQIEWLLDPTWALFSVSLSTIWLNTGFSFLIILGG